MRRSPLPPRKKPLPRSTKPLARTPLKRSSVPLARKALPKPVTGLRRASTAKRRQPADAAEQRAFRDAVMARAQGRCEACPKLAGAGALTGVDERMKAMAVKVARRCNGVAVHAHHKAPKGMGGHGDNSPENGVAMCEASHDFVHRQSPAIGRALDLLRRRAA